MEQFADVAQVLGTNLMQQRKRSKLTQKQLANGICSQSMISSIEQGNYVPNAILLAEICQRLGISMEQSLLSNYYAVTANQEFNQQVPKLCNQHQYQELLTYLDQPGLVDQLYLESDLQKYYYYRGVAIYQLHQGQAVALQTLKLALQYTYSPRNQQMTALEAMILSAINFIASEHQQRPNFDNFKLIISMVQKQQITDADENLNLVFYQYGLALLQHHQLAQSADILSQGVQWATKRNANFMLADFLFLLKIEYQALNQSEKAAAMANQYQAVTDLFHQQPYQPKLKKM